MARQEWIYGVHPVSAAIAARPDQVLEVWVADHRRDARAADVAEGARAKGIRVQVAGREVLSRRAGSEQHQGVVARVRPLSPGDEGDLETRLAESGRRASLILVLDGVTDPHNLGACLRTAEAAGASAVVLPRDRAAPITPVVRKVSTGAAERVPVYAVTNLARALRLMGSAGLWVYGMAQEAERCLYELELHGPVALVLGAEGEGLRRLTREHCDGLVSLPMSGQVESLNVSVAAGICLYEIVRQRWAKARPASG